MNEFTHSSRVYRDPYERRPQPQDHHTYAPQWQPRPRMRIRVLALLGYGLLAWALFTLIALGGVFALAALAHSG